MMIIIFRDFKEFDLLVQDRKFRAVDSAHGSFCVLRFAFCVLRSAICVLRSACRIQSKGVGFDIATDRHYCTLYDIRTVLTPFGHCIWLSAGVDYRILSS